MCVCLYVCYSIIMVYNVGVCTNMCKQRVCMTLRDSPNNSSLKHCDKNTVTLGWLNMVQSERGK